MKKYLTIYEKSIESGRLMDRNGYEFAGLCSLFRGDRLFHLFDDRIGCWYWAYDGGKFRSSSGNPEMLGSFSPLRQNIVLFMAAMNNEL